MKYGNVSKKTGERPHVRPRNNKTAEWPGTTGKRTEA